MSGRTKTADDDADFVATEVLPAALDLVAEGGLAALTLRPLAERLGATVAKLTYRIGSKDDIIARIVEAARAEEAQFFEVWRRRLDAAEPLSADTLAHLVDAILDELAGLYRRRSLFFLELVQASAWDEGVRRALRPWLGDRARFWAQLSAKVSPAPQLGFTLLLTAYVVDELAYSVALNALPAYRLLRRLCVARLCAGLAGGERGEAALFAALVEELGDLPGGVQVDHASQAASDWREQAAAGIADLIITRGAGAVTHRAIATAIGIAPSTLAYHHPTQEDLVVAGLEYIIRRLHGGMSEFAERIEAPAMLQGLTRTSPGSVDIGRATYAVALASARFDRLAPCAADMRRRRGENLYTLLRMVQPPYERIDPLAAQVLAIASIGYRMLPTDPGDAAGELSAAAFEATLAGLRASADRGVGVGLGSYNRIVDG